MQDVADKTGGGETESQTNKLDSVDLFCKWQHFPAEQKASGRGSSCLSNPENWLSIGRGRKRCVLSTPQLQPVGETRDQLSFIFFLNKIKASFLYTKGSHIIFEIRRPLGVFVRAQAKILTIVKKWKNPSWESKSRREKISSRRVMQKKLEDCT